MGVSNIRENWLHKAIIGTWAFIFLTLPLPWGRLNSWGIFVLLILSVIHYFLSHNKNQLNVIFVVISLIPFIVTMVNVGVFPEIQFYLVEKNLSTIIFPAICLLLSTSGLQISKKQYDGLLLVFLLSIVAIVCFTFVRSFFYSSEFFAHNYLTFDIIHPTYFALYCGSAIVIIFYLVEGLGNLFKVVGYVLVVGLLFYITWLGSRMGFASVTVMVGAISLTKVKKNRQRVLLAIFLTIGVVFVATLIVKSPRLKYRYVKALSKNIDKRGVSWKAGLEGFLESPVMGKGLRDKQEYLDKYYLDNYEEGYLYLGYNSHNYYVESLLTFGSVGAFLLAIFWISLIRFSWNLPNKVLFYILVLFLTISITEVMWVRQKGQVFVYLFVTVTILAIHPRRKSEFSSENGLK